MIDDLISLHLFPEHVFRLAQFDCYFWCDADIVIERTGTPHALGKDALTYHFVVKGPGFTLSLQAIWADYDQATADVRVVAITPDDEVAREALTEWLTSVVDGRRPPRDRFENMRLSLKR